jgi:restriction endonuclease Mrr
MKLRVLSDQKDELAIEVEKARDAYEVTIEQAIQRLSPQDFEHVVDLVLLRTGWARISTLGSTREGIDLEVENAAADEVAFVQVKSAATQCQGPGYLVHL